MRDMFHVEGEIMFVICAHRGDAVVLAKIPMIPPRTPGKAYHFDDGNFLDWPYQRGEYSLVMVFGVAASSKSPFGRSWMPNR